MWFQKQRAEREERRGRQKRKEQPLKQEATSLEKAKREYDLWVLAEEYEEDWNRTFCIAKTLRLCYDGRQQRLHLCEGERLHMESDT